jgi:predicted dehydrogenase
MRIGLVGCGRWGRLILRDLRAAGIEVHVAARGAESRARAVEGGAASVVGDVADLPVMDGYVVASPTITHADVLDSLISTGKPLFVEKPMTNDPARARRLVEQAGDRLFVMDKWRYHPVVEAMRDEIASGNIGEVLGINLIRQGWSNPHKDVSGLWILAPHDLSIVLHLTGRIPPVIVALPAAPGRADLGVTAHLGGPGFPSVMMDLGIASPEHRRRCQVIGSKGCLELRDGYEERLFIRDGAPGDPAATERVRMTNDAMPLRAELDRFVAFVGGTGPAPMSSAAEGLLIVERVAEIEALVGAGRSA